MKKDGKGGPSTRQLCGKGLEFGNSETKQEPLAAEYYQEVKFKSVWEIMLERGKGPVPTAKQTDDVTLTRWVIRGLR